MTRRATYPRRLTRVQMEILEFELATWHPRALGRRDAAILERFGHTPIRHAQIVNYLIDHPAAAEYNPALVRQLRELRDRRATTRSRGAW